jgi:hypothetical protein
LAGVVAVIVSGLLLLVQGEAEFDTTGFALVMSASCMSGLRFTLTQLLLHGSKGAQEGGRSSSDGGGHSECCCIDSCTSSSIIACILPKALAAKLRAEQQRWRQPQWVLLQ